MILHKVVHLEKAVDAAVLDVLFLDSTITQSGFLLLLLNCVAMF